VLPSSGAESTGARSAGAEETRPAGILGEMSASSTAPGSAADGGAPTVIFLHIGKTAGTTMRRVLRRQFPASQTLLIRNRAIKERDPDAQGLRREQTLRFFAEMPESERARARLILAHTVFGLHESVPGPSTYITMLRDPVSLTMSQFHYVVRNPNHPLHAEATAEGATLESYVTGGSALEADNSQVRAISGDLDTPFGRCTLEMLDRAKRNVEERFSFVGLTERFDESLVLLRRTFGWKPPYYVAANVTPSSRKAPVPQETRAIIEEMNALDRQLYDWAADRFARAIESSPGFDEELHRFRRRNRRYQPIGKLTHSVPKRLKYSVVRPGS
jgi:Galactose-3-O-sulfotransferase